VQMGLRVAVTAGSETKLARARSLGAELAVSRHEEWEARVILEFGGGVDVILDCVGGAYWESNAKVLQLDGVWVLYGLLGGPKVDIYGLLTLNQSLTLTQSLTLKRSTGPCLGPSSRRGSDSRLAHSGNPNPNPNPNPN